ncbi:hypothetical protein VVD49_15655 [Uliginosibacterium sp. H3]|uniref:Uncharacterized protein n=1 Tax=Uliginosibacterium silvisoli TaxID=3114758 RepID=A0ABU6K843_9RHOO|nr:hypothetical protein [Uliginosibacterium sp. H3]
MSRPAVVRKYFTDFRKQLEAIPELLPFVDAVVAFHAIQLLCLSVDEAADYMSATEPVPVSGHNAEKTDTSATFVKPD